MNKTSSRRRGKIFSFVHSKSRNTFEKKSYTCVSLLTFFNNRSFAGCYFEHEKRMNNFIKNTSTVERKNTGIMRKWCRENLKVNCIS